MTSTAVTQSAVGTPVPRRAPSPRFSASSTVHAQLQQWAPQTSTLSKPFLRLPPYRGEAMLVLFCMFTIAIFELSASLAPVFSFDERSGSAATEITIFHNKLKICLAPLDIFAATNYSSISTVSYGCFEEKFPGRLCEAMTSRLLAAQGFAIVAILVAIAGVVNGLFEVRGKAFLTPLMTYIISGILWWLLFFHFVLDSAAFEEKLCRGRSLKGIDFAYKAGWVLGFFSWLWLSLCVIFYCVRRRLSPVKYIFESVDQQEEAAAPQNVA